MHDRNPIVDFLSPSAPDWCTKPLNTCWNFERCGGLRWLRVIPPSFWKVPEFHTARKVIILRAVGNSLELFGTLGNLAFWTFRILEFRGSPRNSIVYSLAYQILGRALKVPKYTIGFQSQCFGSQVLVPGRRPSGGSERLSGWRSGPSSHQPALP
jgi:hypothetical protein